MGLVFYLCSMDTLDSVIELLQHEFFMVLAGLLFFFYLKYSWMRNRGKANSFKEFWNDQNDEVGTSFIGGLIFLVWDDEVLRAIEITLAFFGRDGGAIEMERAFYLLVAPFIERIYTLYGVISRFKKK